MSKEITKAFILQQLQDKFSLRDFEDEKFTFGEKVHPIYNIAEHVQTPMIRETTVNITGGTVGRAFIVVPSNERWHMRGYNVVFMTGVFTVSGLFITRHVSPSTSIYLDLEPDITVSYAVNLPNPVRLDAGDIVSLYINGYTSSGNLRLYIDYIKETIR